MFGLVLINNIPASNGGGRRFYGYGYVYLENSPCSLHETDELRKPGKNDGSVLKHLFWFFTSMVENFVLKVL